MLDNRYLPLTGASHGRDLGGLITADGKITRFHVFYRCDGLDIRQAEEIRKAGIRTIIDLRGGKDRNSARPSGLTYQAVSLPDFSLDSAESQAALTQIFQTIASSPGAVLYGGDKAEETEILTVLLFMLAGVQRQDILAFCSTCLPIAPDEEYPPASVAEIGRFHDAVQHAYGSAEAYLQACGIQTEILQNIRSRFMEVCTAKSSCIRLPIRHALNVRDLGGYPAAAGMTAWHRYLRADDMSRLDQADLDFLYAYGVRHVIDLRSLGETREQPDSFLQDPRFDCRSVPYMRQGEDTTADITKVLAANPLQHMQDFYRSRISAEDVTARVLSALAACGKEGVLFHCTAGKDRTGITAALLMTLAGVPEEKIVSEYQMTQYFLAADERFRNLLGRQQPLHPMLESRPLYIEAALAELHRLHGSLSGYFQALPLRPEEWNTLREGFLPE